MKVVGAESPLGLYIFPAYWGTLHRGQHVSRLERYFSTLFVIFDLALVPPFGCLRDFYVTADVVGRYANIFDYDSHYQRGRLANPADRITQGGTKTLKLIEIPLDPNRYVEFRKCSVWLTISTVIYKD